MKSNPSSNVRNRKEEADEYGFPTNGDWSGLEAQAHQDLKKSKEAIEKGRTGGYDDVKPYA